jgi:hypothetical protein
MLQLDAALRRMNEVAALPERHQHESFRGYFVRVAPGWAVAHSADAPELAEHVRALVAREHRRHPRLAATQPPQPSAELPAPR